MWYSSWKAWRLQGLQVRVSGTVKRVPLSTSGMVQLALGTLDSGTAGHAAGRHQVRMATSQALRQLLQHVPVKALAGQPMGGAMNRETEA